MRRPRRGLRGATFLALVGCLAVLAVARLLTDREPADGPGAAPSPIEPRSSAASPEPEAPRSPSGSATSPAPTRVGSSIGEDPAGAARMAQELSRSFVHVGFWLRHDGGEPPSSLSHSEDHLVRRLRAERPIEMPGFVLAQGRVLIPDPEIDERFVARITVTQHGRTVPAHVGAWATGRTAALLVLDGPLPEAVPLVFAPESPPPYRSVTHVSHAGDWSTAIEPAFGRVEVTENGTAAARTDECALVVDAAGTPVGVTLSGWLHVDGSWKGSPLTWSFVAREDLARVREEVDARLARELLAVRLRLRPPRTADDEPDSYRTDVEEEEAATERHAVGLLVRPRIVFVLERLDAARTARLESIDVLTAEGRAVPARFLSADRELGAFLVTVGEDLPGCLAFSTSPLRARLDDLLLAVHADVRAGRRRVHVTPFRLTRFTEGRRGQVEPFVSGSKVDQFLFERGGALVAAAVLPRTLGEEQVRWRRPEPALVPAEGLSAAVAAAAERADPALVPVPAEKEGLGAWLGVETQGLDRELARANGVGHLTQDGKTGLLVSYVYAGSPAALAGIEPGAVLLRLQVPDRSAPIPLGVGKDEEGGWQRDDPEMDEFLERLRQSKPGYLPWPSVQNGLNTLLTEVGVGKPFTLEYAVAGQVRRAEMRVAESPPHYGVASVHRDDVLGLSVRSLTYEVRRHFRIEPDRPGVIVSRVERGSRAAVAGLRRFDIVLEVNGRPVEDARAFGEAVAAGGEVRLAVRNLLKQRVVKVVAPSR